jgi:hypothetical protein
MKYTVLVIGLSLSALAATQGRADDSGARIYYCTALVDAGIHLQTYWGDNSATLQAAQDSAMYNCQEESAYSSYCKVSECWSSLPDGSDPQPEPTSTKGSL